jgi:hypothetical protein
VYGDGGGFFLLPGEDVAVLLLAVAVSLLLGNAKEAVATGAVEFDELRRARAGAVP